MNLDDKLNNLIETYQEGNKLKVFFTTSWDEHKKIQEFVWESDLALKVLKNSLQDFEKYGEVAGCDPKGQWVIDVDFELV